MAERYGNQPPLLQSKSINKPYHLASHTALGYGR